MRAIMMTVALPKWRQQTQRAREEELIFRGEQYARAIVLYMVKNRGAYPPSIDILVEQRYLRKKWKDPITNDDFALVEILWSVGRSVKVRKKLLEDLSSRLAAAGFDMENVMVVFKETSWENWAFAGGRLIHA